MKKKISLFLILSTSIILWKCASQTTPTGGPKDETPPTLKRSTPANNQTNFKGKAIELTFDELLQLNNPKEEIIITPSPGKDIIFTLKQNKVIIEPKAGWADSTTYSLTFREGIKDLNEGNPAENLHLAFSTGPTIDSLQISGYMTESLTEKIPLNITVALYTSDTFDIFKHSPAFSTKTDSAGIFKIENLKAADYFLYAFDDKNKNLKVDSKNEKFGFIPKSIRPGLPHSVVPTKPTRPGSLVIKRKTDTLSVAIYQLDSRPLRISSIRNTGKITQIKLNKNIVSYNIQNPSKAKIDHSFGQNQSEITIYNELPINDSIPLSIHGTDSLNLTIDSTFFIKRIESKLPKEKLIVNIASASINPETLQVEVKTKFSKPIRTYLIDSIYFTPDAVPERAPKPKATDKTKDLSKDDLKKPEKEKLRDTKVMSKKDSLKSDSIPPKKMTKLQVNQKDITIDSITKTLTISKVLDKKLIPAKTKQLNIVLETAFIQSIENDSSQRVIKAIPISDLETTGILHIEVITTHKNYEIQLLTSNGDLIQKVRNVKKYSFKYLPAQECKLLFYADLNNNGAWDPQDFYERKQQEPSFFYQTQEGKYTFPIRPDWEVGPLILKF